MLLKCQQTLSQKLTISQRLQQSLSLLSLSHEELQQAIQKELLENPLLEAVDKPLPDKDADSRFRMYDFLNTPSSGTGLIEELAEKPLSLQSWALQQAEMSFFPRPVKVVLPLLISHLDDRGYFKMNLEELALKERLSLDLLNKSLKALQSLEPPGLGARDLKECLLLQLDHRKENTRDTALIIKNHLHNMQERKYQVIAHDLNLSLKEVMKRCQIIQSLDPDPCRRFSSQPTFFVRPDLYIYKEGRSYRVILNGGDLPVLRLSRGYTNSLYGPLKPGEKRYLNDRLSAAQWFLHALRQRREKIKKMADCLIEQQRDFFEKGFSFLKPLKMKDMADKMSVHVSTVSRIASNKYAYTDQGMIALKSFFQKGLETEKGELVCVSRVKKAIKKWIEEEEPQRPLSDGELRDKVYQRFHILLLRRSVSKYRASMGISSFKSRGIKPK